MTILSNKKRKNNNRQPNEKLTLPMDRSEGAQKQINKKDIGKKLLCDNINNVCRFSLGLCTVPPKRIYVLLLFSFFFCLFCFRMTMLYHCQKDKLLCASQKCLSQNVAANSA